MARLYQSWGLHPDVVLGHSVGEYAAACVAGVFTLEEGLRLIARRGRLMGDLPRGGKMAAIFAPAERVMAVVAAKPSLSIAAYNGAHVVISGPAEAVEALIEHFTAKGVRCVPLVTSHAFHSALLEPMLDDLEIFASDVEYQPADLPLITNYVAKCSRRANCWMPHTGAVMRRAGAVCPQRADAGGTGLRRVAGDRRRSGA